MHTARSNIHTRCNGQAAGQQHAHRAVKRTYSVYWTSHGSAACTQGSQAVKMETKFHIITLHIIPKKAVYTSLVNHNEQFNTQYNSGRVVFRKNFDREAVYVSGALNGGSTVTARVNSPNITVLNGVVHHVDEVLGFVYKTVLEEIQLDPVTQNFEQLINRARQDLRQDITATTGVFVFAPTNEAMQALRNVDDNYMNNAVLMDMVLERSTLEPDQSVRLTDHNGGYESYNTARSRYNSQLIKIYSAGNDTWVEGGYVKARVVKPDIGCINGVVHQIDAVFGIPTRDLPYTIYCEDWLVSTWKELEKTGLQNYMRDTKLVKNQACTSSANARAGAAVPNTGSGTSWGNSQPSSSSSAELYRDLCGDTVHRCEFTFFVPNGTAIDNFARTSYGRTIMRQPKRWRWILRRLLTFREVIYLDRMAAGQQRVMYSDNGDEIVIRTDSRSNIPSGQRTAYIQYEGVQAQVIHSDIGATNGVMHIISSILFVPDDLTRDVSSARIAAPLSVLVLTLNVIFAMLIIIERWR
ncbi:fasciclin-1 [Elysia marginata]|uniref:Fasciclin-1 n=1 Tax=Elysia marginata TaxID=1093978 RepID=A0AAV4FCM8_9GAST|nr:fasciclin-1 [Elysia marginata]